MLFETLIDVEEWKTVGVILKLITEWWNVPNIIKLRASSQKRGTLSNL